MQNIACRTEINQHSAIIFCNKDIGRFDVQMQQSVLMHHAQATQNFIE